MKRRNYQRKTGKILGKTVPRLGFQSPNSLGSRADSDLKRRRKLTFAGRGSRSPLNDSLEAFAEKSVDAKTSEYAFFKRLKTNANQRFNSKLSNHLEHCSKVIESGFQTKGTSDRVKDGSKRFCFSTPVETSKHEKGLEETSAAFRAAQSGNQKAIPRATNTRSGVITGDLFSMKREKLHHRVRDTWFSDSTEPSSIGCDVVPLLLSRLFTEAKVKQLSKEPSEEKVNKAKKSKLFDSPGSEFINWFHKNYMETEQKPHMEKRSSIFWLDWPEESNERSLQFQRSHIHSSIIPRDSEEVRLAISLPKGESVYRPWFRNYKSLSPVSDQEEGYDLMPERLYLEWDTLNTAEPSHSYHAKFITYPNMSSSSSSATSSYWNDHPWRSDDASHDLTSHFELDLRRNIIEENAITYSNLYTFHPMYSSNVHQLSSSPVNDHMIEPPGYDEIITIPFSRSSFATNLLEAAPSPRRRDHF